MADVVIIGGRPVGPGHPCYVVAEAGVNHNGSVDLAKRLVEAAVEAGADAIKFQKRTVTDILVAEALARPYDSPTALGRTYGEHRERLELSDAAFAEVAAFARARGIALFASAWDVRSADFLHAVGVPALKIASADVTNLPLVAHIARLGCPVVMSTGMSTMEEVADAVSTVRRVHDELVLLQCTSVYPCAADDLHLRAMATLRAAFRVPVGYSGHDRSLATSVAAVALGAVLVERHITLDRAMRGPDHAASLLPGELAQLVRDIREVERAMGSADKRVLDGEWPSRRRLAKSVVTSRAIPRGATITREMLAVKGPGTGLSPRLLARLVGRVAPRDIAADTTLTEEALEWTRPCATGSSA